MRKALIRLALSALVLFLAHAVLAADSSPAGPAATSVQATSSLLPPAAEPQATGFAIWLSSGVVKLPPASPENAVCQKCYAMGEGCCLTGDGLLQARLVGIYYCC